jgi:hypothetical protein
MIYMLLEATVIVIQIEEGKTFGGILQNKTTTSIESPQFNFNNDGIVPSQRRPSIRRPSLLVPMEYGDNRDISAPTTAPTDVDLEDIRSRLNMMDVTASQMINEPESLNKEETVEQQKYRRERRDSINIGSFDPTAIYEPPAFALIHKDTDMPPPVTRDKLEVDEFPLSTISTAWIKIMTQGLSEWIKLPIIVCRGTEDG